MAETDVAELARLLRDLHDGDWKVVTQAQRDLVRVGASAVEPLCGLLNGDLRVAWRAAWVLGRLNDRRAVVPLSERLLELGNEEQRSLPDPHNLRVLFFAELAEGLGALGHPAGSVALCAALFSKHALVRKHALEALKGIGRAATPELCAALDRLPAEGLAAAALHLGNEGDARAVAPLCSVLEHADWKVRLRATEALGTLAPRYPVMALRAAIPHLERNQRAWSPLQEPLRRASKRTLGRIEAATAHLQDVPLPSTPPLTAGENLPLPAASGHAEGEDDGADRKHGSGRFFRLLKWLGRGGG